MTWIKDNLIPSELSNKLLCPANPEDIFKAYEMPLEDVRVIMLLQDVYPRVADAKGIALAVDENRKFEDYPKSLQIISSVLTDNPDLFDPSLSLWIAQGIFLTNAALTCRAGQSGSHLEYWSYYTTELFKLLNDQRGVYIFVFFGQVAAQYKQYIDCTRHICYTVPHPASRYDVPVDIYKRLFEDVSNKYESLHGSPIDWILPF